MWLSCQKLENDSKNDVEQCFPKTSKRRSKNEVDFFSTNHQKTMPKWSQKWSKNHQKSMKKRKRKTCSIFLQFLMKKWSKTEPKWSQRRAKMEPKWHTGATRTRHSAPGTSKSVPRPLRDRFWTTLGSDVDGFLMDFGPFWL